MDEDETITEKLCLAVNFLVEMNSLTLSVFAPYWMVNRTGEEIVYKVDSEHIFQHPVSLEKAPFLLAFNPDKVSGRSNKMCLSVRGSAFSEPFPLNVVPYRGSFLPPSNDKTYNLCVSLGVELAGIGFSKIITVCSFYNVFNISKRTIQFSENELDWSTVASQCSQVFFPFKTGSKQTMCFRVENSAYSSMVKLMKFIFLCY